MEKLIMVITTIGTVFGVSMVVICGAVLVKYFIEEVRAWRRRDSRNSYRYFYSRDYDEESNESES